MEVNFGGTCEKDKSTFKQWIKIVFGQNHTTNPHRLINKEVFKQIIMRNSECITLPEFNLDKTVQNAKAWWTAADLYVRERPINGSALMIVLSKVMQGSASAWLFQISYDLSTISRFITGKIWWNWNWFSFSIKITERKTQREWTVLCIY